VTEPAQAFVALELLLWRALLPGYHLSVIDWVMWQKEEMTLLIAELKGEVYLGKPQMQADVVYLVLVHVGKEVLMLPDAMYLVVTKMTTRLMVA